MWVRRTLVSLPSSAETSATRGIRAAAPRALAVDTNRSHQRHLLTQQSQGQLGRTAECNHVVLMHSTRIDHLETAAHGLYGQGQRLPPQLVMREEHKTPIREEPIQGPE